MGVVKHAILTLMKRNKTTDCAPIGGELTRLTTLDYHRSESSARSTAHDYLAAAERHVKACEPLQREAERLDVHISDVAGLPEWRKEARRLEKAGRAILADDDTYGAYLDAIAAGKPRARLTVDQFCSHIEDADFRSASPRNRSLAASRTRDRRKASLISSKIPKSSANCGNSSRSANVKYLGDSAKADALACSLFLHANDMTVSSVEDP